jgi:hypothetical protein
LGYVMLNVSFFGELAACLGELDEPKRPEMAVDPVFFVQQDTKPIPPQGFCVLDLGGPSDGYIRYVRSISVYNLNTGLLRGVSTGTSIVVITGGDYHYLETPGNPAGTPPIGDTIKAINGTDWRDFYVGAQYFPRFYREGQLTVKDSEKLQIIVTDFPVPANTVVAAFATTIDYQRKSEDNLWSVGG